MDLTDLVLSLFSRPAIQSQLQGHWMIFLGFVAMVGVGYIFVRWVFPKYVTVGLHDWIGNGGGEAVRLIVSSENLKQTEAHLSRTQTEVDRALDPLKQEFHEFKQEVTLRLNDMEDRIEELPQRRKRTR